MKKLEAANRGLAIAQEIQNLRNNAFMILFGQSMKVLEVPKVVEISQEILQQHGN
jgi:hypothetical protein